MKERNFTTPLALYSKRSAPASSWKDTPRPPAKTPKAGEGGKGVNRKGKQQNRKVVGNQAGCASHTPEGELICYRYNTVREKCKASKCKYKHVCGICFGTHPLFQCSAKNRPEPPPDTAGKGAS